MIALVLLLVLAVLFLPSYIAQSVLRYYSRERDDFPGSGGELARHLLDRRGLKEVAVEITAAGDHYDPQDRAVRLSQQNYDGRSLTAVAVAAHEVGHALQHAEGYTPLKLRSSLVHAAQQAERIGAWVMVLLPVMALVTRSPGGIGVMLLVGVLSFGVSALVHLITLPVELDASYRRAMPILAMGYIAPQDQLAARRILTACAFTYVASALASVLNIWRWIALLRR
ncbi:peptidase [Halorhodospira abdelmalekii]|uniref:zinc metallopeptidase n=1 Tax=Halorhodospira abdelmalekii TaxID=421629 RepID=UPI001906EB53|nr:peptidase [Halorhodospira abdelmalekii]